MTDGEDSQFIRMSGARSFAHIVHAAGDRITGELDYATEAYVTDGGTYVIASTTVINNDERPHDLVAVLPLPLEDTRVVVLRPTGNPDFVDALREELDPQDDDSGTNALRLEFKNSEALRHTLEHTGDPDAPVMITAVVAVVVDGQTHELRDRFDASPYSPLDDKED